MTREVRILQGAKTDFREIKAYVQKHFGEAVWLEVNQELKEAIGHFGMVTRPQWKEQIK